MYVTPHTIFTLFKASVTTVAENLDDPYEFSDLMDLLATANKRGKLKELLDQAGHLQDEGLSFLDSFYRAYDQF